MILIERFRSIGREHPLWAALAGVVLTWAVLRILGGLAAFAGGLVLVAGVAAIAFLAIRRHGAGAWAALTGWGQRIMSRARAYRFEGEQANHADTARETTTTLGLMALRAQETTAESQVQVWQTRSGLQARATELARLETAFGGLTHEQLGERSAILRALTELRAAEMDAEAPGDRLWAPAAERAPRIQGFLGAAAGFSIARWVAIGGVAMGIAGFATAAVQSARLNHAKGDLAETRAGLREAMAERDQWKDDFEAANRAVIQAAQDAAMSAEAIAAERARARTAARREQERQREIQNVLTGSGEPPAWRLRDDEPVSGEPSADADPNSDSGRVPA